MVGHHGTSLLLLQVFKTGVTHYFSMEPAKRDFGYDPEPKTLEGVVKWFRERGHGRRRKRTGAKRSWLTSVLIYVLFILALFLVLMAYLPVVH